MHTPMKLSRRAVLGRGLAVPLSLSLSPFMALRSGVANAATSSLAIVMNSGEASVSVIDMASRKVVRTLPTLREPSHCALSQDRNKLYIADASGNALFIVDPHKWLFAPFDFAPPEAFAREEEKADLTQRLVPRVSRLASPTDGPPEAAL